VLEEKKLKFDILNYEEIVFQILENVNRHTCDTYRNFFFKKFIEIKFFFLLVGFSYNRTQTFSVPGTKKGMKALVTGIF